MDVIVRVAVLGTATTRIDYNVSLERGATGEEETTETEVWKDQQAEKEMATRKTAIAATRSMVRMRRDAVVTEAHPKVVSKLMQTLRSTT